MKLIGYICAATSRAKQLNELCVAGQTQNEIGLIHKIRWLSRVKVMKCIYFKLIAILHMLKINKESNQARSETASYLYERMASIYFLGCFAKTLSL